MVAASRDRIRALLGTAVLAVLLASTFPPVLAEHIAGLPHSDASASYALSVRHGEAIIKAGTSASSQPLKFIGNGSYYVEFPIYNTGSQASPSNLPVWLWFDENITGQAIRCKSIPSVPAATSAGPGKLVAQLRFTTPTDVFKDPDGNELEWVNGYTMRILVNRAPTGTPAYQKHVVDQPKPEVTQECPTNRGGTFDAPVTSSGTECPAPTGRDTNACDNILVAHFVKDARLDLRVDDIKWCRGEAHLAAGYNPATDRHERSREKVCDDDGVSEDTRFWNYTSTMMEAEGVWFNTTRKNETSNCGLTRGPDNTPGCDFYYNVPNATYFEVRVKNDLETATWPHNTDWAAAGCTAVPTPPPGHTTGTPSWFNLSLSDCPGYEFEYDIRVSGLDDNVRASSLILTNHTAFPRGTLARSVTWHLVNWTGPFKVFATVNHQNNVRFPDALSTNNDLIIPTVSTDPEVPSRAPYEVAWTDLEPILLFDSPLTNLKTSPSDPYPYRDPIVIKLQALLRNHGTAEPTTVRWNENAPQFVPKTVSWRATLDGKVLVAQGALVGTKTGVGNASTEATNPWYVNITYENTTIPGDRAYISPGEHTLCLTVDVANVARETNESNNEKCVKIYVQDTSAPRILPVEGSNARPRITTGPLRNGTAIDHSRPNETFWIHTNVSDDDITNVNVVAQFTLVSNESVVRNYTMSRHLSHADRTDANGNTIRTYTTGAITNFSFVSSEGTTENWTMRVIATDTFQNKEESVAQTFQLVRWPIQTKNADHTVLGVPNGPGYDPNGQEYPYGADNLLIYYEIEVWSNETGVRDQSNHTDNLGFRVFTPNNKTFYVNGSPNGGGWQPLVDCPGRDFLSQVDKPCTGQNRFHSPYIQKEEGGPGLWYVHIEIKDVGGDIRVINRSFTLRDSLPILTNFSIGATELDAGQSLNVRVNMTDDFDIDVENGGAMVNFTRTRDNKTFSIPLTDKVTTPIGGRNEYAYNDTITTGFGKKLDEAGDFLVSFVARDTQGNWNATPGIPFKLKDTQAPNLVEAGVDQALQEIGLNVTWRARVVDETNVTVRLRVHPAGSDEDLIAVNMTPEAPGSQNYTWSANISVEGSYVWEIFATDSALQTSSVRSGPLTIASNLGPRFEIREPGVVVDGSRYARAAPRIVLLVYDNDGVNKESIELQIAGENVTPEDPVPAPGGIKGYLVNYTIPSSARFNHRDVVAVNLTAIDLSDKLLQGFLNFTFTVDDTPPTVRVADYAPRFPLDGRGTVNVSLRTQFTLEAADNDGLPTGVEAVRYRIFGGGNNTAESVYTGPFTIEEAPGVYTGPKVYQIQYWAVDQVGNQNMSGGRATYETLTVYVDDIPPSLDPFGSLPQGRYINATFIDDRSGVDRAIVWYSVNGAAHQAIALDFVAGIWTGVLPEGRKGDRVSYYLEAFDRVGNRETFGNVTEPYSSYIVGNHLPSIRITAPVEGSRLARTVDLTWTASDQDGDNLVFTVYVKSPGRSTFTELARLESNDARRYPLDTTRFPDGEYVIRVTASDGSFVALAETSVTILNRASAFGTPGSVPSDVRAGQPVLLTVEVTKAQAVVEARVMRDGVLVQAFPMNDEGRDGDEVANDGKYSVRVPLDSNGRYAIEFHATYQEDGIQKTATISGGEIVVQGAGLPGGVGLWLVLIGLLVVAGVGVAAFVLLRRR